MNASALSAALWAIAATIAATIVALLPLPRQFTPGLALLTAAPGLIAWLGIHNGRGWAQAAALGFRSMFRRPLGHLCKRVARRMERETPQ